MNNKLFIFGFVFILILSLFFVSGFEASSASYSSEGHKVSVGNTGTSTTYTTRNAGGEIVSIYESSSYSGEFGIPLNATVSESPAASPPAAECAGDYGEWSDYGSCINGFRSRTRTDSTSCTETEQISCSQSSPPLPGEEECIPDYRCLDWNVCDVNFDSISVEDAVSLGIASPLPEPMVVDEQSPLSVEYENVEPVSEYRTDLENAVYGLLSPITGNTAIYVNILKNNLALSSSLITGNAIVESTCANEEDLGNTQCYDRGNTRYQECISKTRRGNTVYQWQVKRCDSGFICGGEGKCLDPKENPEIVPGVCELNTNQCHSRGNTRYQECELQIRSNNIKTVWSTSRCDPGFICGGEGECLDPKENIDAIPGVCDLNAQQCHSTRENRYQTCDLRVRSNNIKTVWKTSTCDRGLVCGNEGECVEPLPCELTSAHWSKEQSLDGEVVNLIVEGNNCNNEKVIFRVYEEDFFGDKKSKNNPRTVRFKDGVATGEWVAEYYEDISGNPEFYFVAKLRSDSSTTIQSGLMEVIKDEVSTSPELEEDQYLVFDEDILRVLINEGDRITVRYNGDDLGRSLVTVKRLVTDASIDQLKTVFVTFEGVEEGVATISVRHSDLDIVQEELNVQSNYDIITKSIASESTEEFNFHEVEYVFDIGENKGIQTRVCEDLNLCGDSYQETQQCLLNLNFEYTPENLDLIVNPGESVGFSVLTDISIDEPISVEWIVDGNTQSQDSGLRSVESSFNNKFSEKSEVTLKVGFLDLVQEVNWNVGISEDPLLDCKEDWVCEFGICQNNGFKYAENCFDANQCGTTVNKPVKQECSCLPTYNCGEWTECSVDYSLTELLNGETIFHGSKTRTCQQTSFCTEEPSTFVEEESCKLGKEVELIIVEWCFEDYVEVYDTELDKLVARVKQSLANDLSLLDVEFTLSDQESQCQYCFDGVKNYDEEGIDCGGANCDACVALGPEYKDYMEQLKLILWMLFALSAVVYLFSEKKTVIRFLKGRKDDLTFLWRMEDRGAFGDLDRKFFRIVGKMFGL